MAASQALRLFRFLLPSWKFFADTEALPELFYRTRPSGQHDWGPWTDALAPERPRRFPLLLNARGNLDSAFATAVDLLAQDLEREVAQARSVSYRLVQGLLERRVRRAAATGQPLELQFKLCQGSVQGTPQDFLLSAIHEVTPWN